MFDELFEMFERDGDGRNERRTGNQRGIRGWFSRLFGGDDEPPGGEYDERARRRRYDDDDGDDDGRAGSRRRERESFDFGDD